MYCAVDYPFCTCKILSTYVHVVKLDEMCVVEKPAKSGDER